jgi:hypothetical protein
VTIGFTSSEKFGNCGYNFCSFQAKRKCFRVVPYLGKAGSRSFQSGQRGILRRQSRTVLSGLADRRGQPACLRRTRAVPKHVRAAARLPRQQEVDQPNKTLQEHQRLQIFLARTAQQRTATSAAAPPVTAAGWKQPSLCTANTGFPVNSQTASSREKHPEKAEKTATYWYTKFEDDQSSNTYPKSWGKTEEKVPRGSKSSKNSFLVVNQAQKPIYRPKSPEMSGSMSKWCFQGSSMCPKFYEKSIQEVKHPVDCRTFAKLIPKTSSLVGVKI